MVEFVVGLPFFPESVRVIANIIEYLALAAITFGLFRRWGQGVNHVGVGEDVGQK